MRFLRHKKQHLIVDNPDQAKELIQEAENRQPRISRNEAIIKKRKEMNGFTAAVNAILNG